MASPRGVAFRIELPHIDSNSELPSDNVDKRAVWIFVTRQHSSGIAEIAYQHGNAEAVVVPAMLPRKGQIRLRQRVQPNQLSLIRGEGEQFSSL